MYIHPATAIASFLGVFTWGGWRVKILLKLNLPLTDLWSSCGPKSLPP
jgi:hypothetical protein